MPDNGIGQYLFHGLDPAAPDHVRRETFDLQTACLFLFQTALTHIEDRFILHLPHRRPVTATHVVGVNFQLWTRIDARSAAQQNITALLLGIGMLGIRCHINQSAEFTAAGPRSDALDERPARAVRDQMVGTQIDHTVILLQREKQHVQLIGSLPSVQIEPVTHIRTGELARRHAKLAPGGLLDLKIDECLGREKLDELRIRPFEQLDTNLRLTGLRMQYDQPECGSARDLDGQFIGIPHHQRTRQVAILSEVQFAALDRLESRTAENIGPLHSFSL